MFKPLQHYESGSIHLNIELLTNRVAAVNHVNYLTD